MKMKLISLGLTACLSLLLSSQQALASGGSVHLKHAHINVTDQAQLLRGLTVFTEVCMGCHSAKYVTYKGLIDYPELGVSREMADSLRGDKSLTSGMNTELLSEDAKESYGKVPPDLSLVVLARRGGADYIYSLLTGYKHDPEGKVTDGNYNEFFPGNLIAMPDPLGWLDHDEADTADLEQQANDVSAFLAFIADPHQNERRAIGGYVMGFLLLLAIVLLMLKRELWKDVH